MSIAENLMQVHRRIREAAEKSGRSPETIKLVAVTKTVGCEEILSLIHAGQELFGENRPQSLRDKAKELANYPIKWHFIGSLQLNKIKYVYPLADLVHSVDSIELLEVFSQWALKTGRKCPCLLEIKISSEAAKHGFIETEVLKTIESVKNRPELDIRGMMGMAPFIDDQSIVRASFRKLAELFRESKKLECDSYKALELSMGMSDDYQIAIEEGATIIRIGRALFL